METPQNAPATKEFLVTGISRSGRVRKKSTKLLDFQSPDEVEKKPKRSSKQTARNGNSGGGHGQGRGRPVATTATHIQNRHSFEGLDDVADDDAELNDEFEAEEEQFEDNVDEDLLPAAPDSDEDLKELMAGIVEGEPTDLGNNGESKVRQSLYMIEKANKRKILKDGKVITGKLERKDKGKSRYTAYSMWAREFRKTTKFSKNQDLDFSNAARRLGELWANVSNKEKNAWRRKAKIQATKAKAREKTSSSVMSTVKGSTSSNSSFYNRPTTSRTRKLAERQKTPPPSPASSVKLNASSNATPTSSTVTPMGSATKRKRNNSFKNNSNTSFSPTVPNNVTSPNNLAVYSGGNVHLPNTSTPTSVISTNNRHHHHQTSLPKIEFIDAAAHLKLLGESLTIIGERLKEHEGQIAVSGSLSVLLDSLLCSLGPLLCLTTHIPGLERKPQLSENLAATLDNIAYVMPGL